MRIMATTHKREITCISITMTIASGGSYAGSNGGRESQSGGGGQNGNAGNGGSTTSGQSPGNAPDGYLVLGMPLTWWQKWQDELAKKLILVDRSAGSSGGRIIHLDYGWFKDARYFPNTPRQLGRQLNSDVGPLTRYHHWPLGAAARGIVGNALSAATDTVGSAVGDAVSFAGDATIPFPAILPACLFNYQDPSFCQGPVVD
jgi:hypothetical protein